MPVLAKEAVEGTSVEEYGEILVSILWPRRVCIPWITYTRSPRTYPVGNAVCGQGIVIPGELPLFRRYTREFSSFVLPKAAIPQPFFRDPAFIHADFARDPLRILGRFLREPEGGSALLMSLHRHR